MDFTLLQTQLLVLLLQVVTTAMEAVRTLALVVSTRTLVTLPAAAHAQQASTVPQGHLCPSLVPQELTRLVVPQQAAPPAKTDTAALLPAPETSAPMDTSLRRVSLPALSACPAHTAFPASSTILPRHYTP